MHNQQDIMNRTSYSDGGGYPQFCLDAAMNDEVFKSFRSNEIYNTYVELATEENGKLYLSYIEKYGSYGMEQWLEFAKNDLYGGPSVYMYSIEEDGMEFAPNTLYYVSVLKDIMSRIDSKDIKSVCEIGVGYGGQCRILCEGMKQIKEYILVDLPEVLSLTERYLSNYKNLINNIKYINGKESIDDIKCDLVISNFAFSELIPEVQKKYLEKIVAYAKRGYMIWNDISEKEYGGITLEEMLERIPNSEVVRSDFLSRDATKILVWDER